LVVEKPEAKKSMASGGLGGMGDMDF